MELDTFAVAVIVLCVVTPVHLVVAAMVRRFVRRKEPEIWRSFGWSALPGFFSLRARSRDGRQGWNYLRWLRGQGGPMLTGRYPEFRGLWRMFQLTWTLAMLSCAAAAVAFAAQFFAA